MVGRPYWSGQLKMSLVSFGIQLYPAIDLQAGIAFHQIHRETGQRVRHLNVVGDEKEPVENSDIAKILEAVDRAYAESRPLVVLFGRRVKP